ncbi:unnamed protein product [Phaedon cochleariae]|uniref:HIT domain-containing protein n=1 Tax=Phaedon cochleariae TaxID=80249 RepID=A0A9P0DFW2_PHACE|nr:unnamed protein product [Phaedon cochleariae]
MPKRKIDADNEKPESESTDNKKAHWSLGLLKSINDPELIVKSDDLVTVIKDAYPKAEFHYLVLPKEDISSLKALKKEHVPILKHMEEVAKKLIGDEKHKHRNFKLGYHAEASMARLHLHIISDDMNSPCVKTKKHWNSFTTNFFLSSTDVWKSLKENGEVTLPSKETCVQLMNTPLKCHKCDYLPKHCPDLKMHIKSHI